MADKQINIIDLITYYEYRDSPLYERVVFSSISALWKKKDIQFSEIKTKSSENSCTQFYWFYKRVSTPLKCSSQLSSLFYPFNTLNSCNRFNSTSNPFTSLTDQNPAVRLFPFCKHRSWKRTGSWYSSGHCLISASE